jgi:hypothetical protein
MNDNFTNDALPSIRNRALLVSVTFRKPQMTKLDRKATRDAEDANGAHGALKTQKLLYPKHLVDPIVAMEAEVYAYLRSKTLRFGDSGMYLLDTRKFMEVADRLEKYKLQRSQLVTVFAQNWANVLDEAQKQQGLLFDASVYPDVSEVAAQFTTSITYLPVGDMGPTLFDTLETEAREAIQQQVQQSTNALVADAIHQPLTRLMDAVLNVYDKTSREDSRIYDSLMTKLEEVVDAMPALNVLNIPELTQLAGYCKEKLVKPVDMIKGKDNQARIDMATAAERIARSAGIDPTTAQKMTEAERRQLASDAANNIMASMKGMM